MSPLAAHTKPLTVSCQQLFTSGLENGIRRAMEASEYLRQIGKRGGEKKSPAKTEAARVNLAKARDAKKTKRVQKKSA